MATLCKSGMLVPRAMFTASTPFVIAGGAASALAHWACNLCTPLVATLCANPSSLIAAQRGIVLWSDLVLFVTPGLGNITSHSSQTVAFAHSDFSTVWTTVPLCSVAHRCIPVMKIISCSLRTNPTTDVEAMRLDLNIDKMMVLLIVLLLPQPC